MNYPFLKTTRPWGADSLAAFKAYGYEALNFQAQNGLSKFDIDFGPVRAAGLRPEVWGVTYDRTRFFQDGALLGEQAVRLGAQAVTMNAEMCAKFTRSSRGLKPIVDGVRAGGWGGPVSLNTLGSPSDPLRWDFEMDVESFLETGGGVAVQAYVNAYDDYSPANCIAYWTRFVPREKLNLTLGLYDPRSENPSKRQLTGAEYAAMLKTAGWGRGISIFLPETALPNDLQQLWDEYLAAFAPEPPPPSPVNPNYNYSEAVRLLKESVAEWRRRGKDEGFVQTRRQTNALRVLLAEQDATKMGALANTLDSLGAPEV